MKVHVVAACPVHIPYRSEVQLSAHVLVHIAALKEKLDVFEYLVDHPEVYEGFYVHVVAVGLSVGVDAVRRINGVFHILNVGLEVVHHLVV